jgi:hypothetical protein
VSKHSAATFIDAVLAGDVLAAEIDDYVDQWHDEALTISLRDFLGMNPDEYALWLSNSDMLETILLARHQHIALTEAVSNVVNDNLDLEASRIAARSDDISKIGRLTRWLRNEGII